MNEKGGSCPYGEETRGRLEELKAYVKEELDKREKSFLSSLDKIYEKLDQLSNRLPTWATLFISFLTLLLGTLLGVLLNKLL